MARLSILAVCLISAFAINYVKGSTLPSVPGFKVSVVENIEDFLKQNPGIKLQQLDVVEEKTFDGISPRIQFKHTLGNRIAGDHILATDAANQQWATPQNVRKTLNYPNGGIGAVITYLEVFVDQSSHLTKSYITRGGIGQRFIEIVIESQNTLYFNHRASIFGY